MSEEPRWRVVRFLGIAALIVLGLPCLALGGAIGSGLVKPFYVPSESMMPTFQVNDRFLALMGRPAELRRGDIILINVRGATYNQRIAALPGDRIAMADGIVVLNGHPVAQRFVRTEPTPVRQRTNWGPEIRRLSEQFPGEAAPHEIYDSGVSNGDDFAGLLIPPDHVFTLGDNRDNSADGRIPSEQFGVGGALPFSRIEGRPWIRTWGPSNRPGQAANH
jgi:signal peptidase I